MKQQSLIGSRRFFEHYLLKFHEEDGGETLVEQTLQEIVNCDTFLTQGRRPYQSQGGVEFGGSGAQSRKNF